MQSGGGLSAPSLGAITEQSPSGENLEIQDGGGAFSLATINTTDELAEEVEASDDSDIESVMTHDDALVSPFCLCWNRDYKSLHIFYSKFIIFSCYIKEI